MSDIIPTTNVHDRNSRSTYQRIPVVALGWSLTIFAMLSFSLCVALMFVVPDQGLHRVWFQFLPYFNGLSWSSYLLGLAEVFFYSWYIALIFAPIYNALVARQSP